MSVINFLSKVIEAHEYGATTVSQIQFLSWVGLMPGSTVREIAEKTKSIGKGVLGKETVSSIGKAMVGRGLVDFKIIPPNPALESRNPQRAYTLTQRGRKLYAILKAEGGVK